MKAGRTAGPAFAPHFTHPSVPRCPLPHTFASYSFCLCSHTEKECIELFDSKCAFFQTLIIYRDRKEKLAFGVNCAPKNSKKIGKIKFRHLIQMSKINTTKPSKSKALPHPPHPDGLLFPPVLRELLHPPAPFPPEHPCDCLSSSHGRSVPHWLRFVNNHLFVAGNSGSHYI